MYGIEFYMRVMLVLLGFASLIFLLPAAMFDIDN
jgi:hypothetical protein